jgi:hypothetical protein
MGNIMVSPPFLVKNPHPNGAAFILALIGGLKTSLMMGGRA